MKKFKLLGFTLLASSLALSSCMLLPKKKTDTGSSSDTGSGSDTPAATDWTDTVKNEMKQYLDGEVIPFISGTWTWEYQSDYGCYCGTSKDTKPATAVAAFESGWNKSLDENEGMLSKIHQKGAITIELYDDDGTTTLDCYFDEEASGYSSETEASMVENFGEALPFPAGTWAGPYATWYGAYYLQSAHSYNYSSIKSSYESKGYKFYIDEEDDSEYFYKQTSLGYICGWLEEDTDLKLGYVYFYFSTESPISVTFELKSNKTTALTGEEVTLTVEREGIDADTVTYTASPAAAATVKTSDNNQAVFTISVEEKTEITFTAKQGDYEATVKVTAYKEYPKPTSVEFKQAKYTVEQGKTLDLSKEYTVLPEDAAGYTLTYAVAGNDKVTISSAGVVSAEQDASTTQQVTVSVKYNETVLGTTKVDVVEPAKEVTVTKTIAQLATTYSWASGTQYASFKLDDKVSIDASTDGNNAKYYSGGSGTWRIYRADSGTFTISVPNDCQLISVTITYTGDNNGSCKASSGEAVSSGVAFSVSGQSATFEVDGGETGKTNGIIRISALSVTYK